MPMFMRKPVTPEIVEAEQLGPGAQAHPQGARPARPGDWVLINHATSAQAVLTNEEFVRDYVPLALPAHLTQPAPGTGPEFQPMFGQPGRGADAWDETDTVVDQPTGETSPTEPFPGPASTWRSDTPNEAPPAAAPQPGLGDVEIHTPMNEGVVGRPTTNPTQDRLQEPGPITTPTGAPDPVNPPNPS